MVGVSVGSEDFRPAVLRVAGIDTKYQLISPTIMTNPIAARCAYYVAIKSNDFASSVV